MTTGPNRLPLSRKLLRAVIARSGGAISGILLTYVVVRTLPLEQAGYFLLGLTVLSFLRPISIFGTKAISLRQIGAAHEFGEWPEIFGHSLRALMIVATTTAVIATAVWVAAPVLAGSFWGTPEMTPVLRTVAFAILPLGLTRLLSSFFQAIQRTVTAVMVLTVNISGALMVLLLVLPIGTATETATALVVVNWANMTLALGWWLWLMRGHVPRLPTFMEILAPSFAVWVATLLTTTTKWNGQIIAAAWISPAEIAYLAVAQRLAVSVSFVMIAINLVTAPMFAGLHKRRDATGMQALASTTTWVMVAVGGLAFTLITSLSVPIMEFFGEGFGAYWYLLVILAAGQLVNAVTGSSGYMLIMGGFHRQYRNLIGFSTAASVFMSLLLIPAFGVVGAATATALGVSVQHLGAAVMVKRYLGVNIYQARKTGDPE